jgi:hypothetical protein
MTGPSETILNPFLFFKSFPLSLILHDGYEGPKYTLKPWQSVSLPLPIHLTEQCFTGEHLRSSLAAYFDFIELRGLHF